MRKDFSLHRNKCTWIDSMDCINNPLEYIPVVILIGIELIKLKYIMYLHSPQIYRYPLLMDDTEYDHEIYRNWHILSK